MTKTSIPRLRSVKWKSGGSLRLLPAPRETVDRELRERLEREVEGLFDDLPGKVAGYALVAWAADGDVGAYVANENTSPYVATAIPHLVEKQVRRVIQGVQIRRALGQEEDGA